MRKLLYLLVFLPTICLADFYDVQWLSITQDTHTLITTDWSYRGNAYFVSGSTSTHPLIADCTIYVTIYATGTINALEINVSSITFINQSIFEDNVESVYGTDLDFSLGYASAVNELRCVRGDDVTVDATVAWRVSDSTIVFIGDAGTYTILDGSGDLGVEKKFEVNGASRFDGTVDLRNSVTSRNTFNIIDDKLLTFGSGNDFVMGYSATADDIRISTSTSISNDGAVLFRITGSSYVVVGTTDNITYVDGKGGLYVQDTLEVYVVGYIPLPSDSEANLKNLAPYASYIQFTDTTNNQVVISTGTATGAFGQLGDFTALPVGW